MISLNIADKEDYKLIKRLYNTAFPVDERAPFLLIKRKAQKNLAQMLTIRDNDEFIGFAYLVSYEALVYLFYFAIDDNKRGKGYGSRVLKLLLERYEGKRLFLAREQLDENAENYEQRVTRHEFYLRNGLYDLPYQIKEAAVVYDVMGTGGTILAEEYDALISGWSGKLMRKLIDMRFIEK